jgi:heterodisulfide reductase subunit C
MGISNIIFIIVLALAIFFFVKSVRRISYNIKLGKALEINDDTSTRWKTMAKVALGQSKMTVRPVAGLLHIIVYVGFVLINIEVLEIIIDGISGSHRILSLSGEFYNYLIGFFDILAFMVLLACVIFLIRRNIFKVKRFQGPDLKGWPFLDANVILLFEIVLMSAILLMNAADSKLQMLVPEIYHSAGSFPISGFLVALLPENTDSLIMIERSMWWLHIVGILIFLNYIPFSKHFHILLAFPNTYYSKLKARGDLDNLQSVTNEVKLMMNPDADPYAVPAQVEGQLPEKFGAEDVTDLTWKSIMDAYTCTECGRCSDVCPANQTGKLLSPRKIMMDVRDRAEELGAHQRKNGKENLDDKKLLGDYILEEELWACNTCNACTEACPVNNDPLQVIIDMRRYLVMEQSKIPNELALTFTNIENNGAPWQFSPSDRLNWKDE